MDLSSGRPARLHLKAFFAVVTQALRTAGHRVVDPVTTAQELAGLGIAWELVCFEDDLDWRGWKGRVCERLCVEVFFDDSPDILDRRPPHTIPFLAVEPRRHHLHRICELDEDDVM